MNIETQEVYSELYQILNFLGNEYIDKLPKSLYDMIKEKRDINYNPEYTEEILLYQQNIKRDTISILALLHLNYWCENEEEKLALNRLFKNNEEKYQENIRNRYNPDNLFKKNQKMEENKKEMSIAIIEKRKWYYKILDIIKRIVSINIVY